MTHSSLIPLMLITGVLLTAAAEPHPATRHPAAADAAVDKVVVGRPVARPAARRRPRPSPSLERIKVATRAATQEPVQQGYVNGTQIYPYADGLIYRVYAAPERVTDIALQPGEVLGAVAAGDTLRWVIADTSSGSGDTRRTHVLVKPFSAELATNVVVTTDRRSYHLSLTSTAATAMAAVSWTYPQDALVAIKRQQAASEAAAPVATGLAVERLAFGYTISGDTPAWRPLRAFDDGRQTFIEFPASLGVGEAPPLFVLGAKGEAELVNYRVRGRFYVVDRLFGAAELRLGTKRQDIVRITRDASGVGRGS